MTQSETVLAIAALALAFVAGLLVAHGGLQSIVLGLAILCFAVGRNRARKAEGRGFGRYFGEVLAFGVVAGIAAMLGAGLSRVA